MRYRLKRGGAITAEVGINVDVFAIALELFDLLIRLDLKALEKKRGFAPRTVQLGDPHSLPEVVNVDFLSHRGEP